jgi:hypothetical protein
VLLQLLKDRFEKAKDTFWDEIPFRDLTSTELVRLRCLAELRDTVEAIPGLLRHRAEDAFAQDAVQSHKVLEAMIERIGFDHSPESAVTFITELTALLSERLVPAVTQTPVVISVLKKRFDEAKFDGWEGYALLDYPKGEDPRDECFTRLSATVDDLPAILREQAEQFRSVNPAWFQEVLEDLSADVGWGIFSEDAAAFVTTLIGELTASSPDTTWRWRGEHQQDESVPFCDPQHITTG